MFKVKETFRVRIIENPHKDSWYYNRVGEIFEIVDPAVSTQYNKYIVKEDYDDNKVAQRLITLNKCVIIKEERKLNPIGRRKI